MLTGYKTYAIMAVLFVAGGLWALGYLSAAQYAELAAVLAPLGGIALRSAVN